MGLEESELIDDDDSIGAKLLRSSNVSCSICLELVIFNNGRSCVKLTCGHEFHLDCIGSAFNSRGAMQCPNCRNIEKGQWLYGSGGPVCDDPHDEEFYDLSYSEMSFGVRWCPFTFPQLPSSFDEGEFPSTVYHDLLGQHAVFAEHAPVSSTSHPCPYFAYYGPIHSSSPNSGASFSDNSFSNHWSGLSGPSEVPSSYALPAMDPHYHGWEHHSPPLPASSNRIGSSDQPSVPSIPQSGFDLADNALGAQVDTSDDVTKTHQEDLAQGDTSDEDQEEDTEDDADAVAATACPNPMPASQSSTPIPPVTDHFSSATKSSLGSPPPPEPMGAKSAETSKPAPTTLRAPTNLGGTTWDSKDDSPPGVITRARARQLHQQLKEGLMSNFAPSQDEVEPVTLLRVQPGT